MNIENEKRVPGNKIPKGKAVGIELEFIIKREQWDSFLRKLGELKCADMISWYIDGSLSYNDDEKEIEIQVLDHRNKLSNLREVLTLVQEHETRVNKSCGLHVHFDQRHQEFADIVRKNSRMMSAMPFLQFLIPNSRRNNSFCRKDSQSIDIERERIQDTKSHFVNAGMFHSKQTIEIRGHHGSLHFGRIKNWIDLCYSILETDGNPGSWKEFMKLYSTPNLKRYINARYKKFQGKELAA